MAERRMFSSKVVCSDAFISMPFSAQALYVQLVMEADDDGFTNKAKRIQRSIEATDADLNMLLEKRFILGFNNGVIVIKHWRMNNQIRKDRYTPTQYQEEYNSLEIMPDGAYTEKPGNHLATTWQPDGNQMATQVRLGKDSIGKVSEDNKLPDSDESKQPADPKPKKGKKKETKLLDDTEMKVCELLGKYDYSLFTEGTPELQKAIVSFVEFRKGIKKPMTDHAIDLLIQKLKGMTQNIYEQIAIINQSIMNGWQGIFPLKENTQPKQYGRKEKLPGWFQPTLGSAELEAIKQVMDEEPATQQEREQLARELQAFGRKDGA